MATDRERYGRELAQSIGYRLEEDRRKEDVWIIRDLYSDIAVLTSRAGVSLEDAIRILERERERGDRA